MGSAGSLQVRSNLLFSPFAGHCKKSAFPMRPERQWWNPRIFFGVHHSPMRLVQCATDRDSQPQGKSLFSIVLDIRTRPVLEAPDAQDLLYTLLSTPQAVLPGRNCRLSTCHQETTK